MAASSDLASINARWRGGVAAWQQPPYGGKHGAYHGIAYARNEK